MLQLVLCCLGSKRPPLTPTKMVRRLPESLLPHIAHTRLDSLPLTSCCKIFLKAEPSLPNKVSVKSACLRAVVSAGCLPPTGLEETEEDGWVGRSKAYSLLTVALACELSSGLQERVSCSCVPIERAPRQWCWLDPSPPRGFGSPLEASKRPVGGNSAPKLAESSRKLTGLPEDRLPSTSVLPHPFLSQDQSHL